MRENDIIAEYVLEKYPELLKTADFALFKFKKQFGEFWDSAISAFKNIDMSNITEIYEALNEGEEE